jgi:hypothetical protein
MAGLNLFQSLSFFVGFLNNGSSFVLNLVFNNIFRQEVYLILRISNGEMNKQLLKGSKDSSVYRTRNNESTTGRKISKSQS